MHWAGPVILTTLLAAIAYGDVRFRRIPNELSLAVALLGLGRLLLTNNSVAARYTLTGGLLTFAVTFFLFSREVIGGGDAKLIPAMALLIGHQQLLNFLMLMSIIGGLLGLVMLASPRFSPVAHRVRKLAAGAADITTDLSGRRTEKTTVPYGVAIAAAGAITLLMAR